MNMETYIGVTYAAAICILIAIGLAVVVGVITAIANEVKAYIDRRCEANAEVEEYEEESPSYDGWVKVEDYNRLIASYNNLQARYDRLKEEKGGERIEGKKEPREGVDPDGGGNGVQADGACDRGNEDV